MTVPATRVRSRLPTGLLAIVIVGACGGRSEGPSSGTDVGALEYVVREEMVPMRDGARLYTRMLSPRDRSGPLPLLLRRTPYSAERAAGSLTSSFRELADAGYLFVFQDIRGRYRSEGQFEMVRPLYHLEDPEAIDESTDTYDTIEWLLANVPDHNGRVGMLGVSYDGWTTVMGAIDPHPALAAVSPQASPADMWIGDDFHHNGAFRLSYGFEYAARMETTREQTAFAFDRFDTFDWYLALGPLSNVNEKYLRGAIPSWNDFVAHPDYDAFWRRQTMIPHITAARVPTLNVAGWWDQEDFYGPLRIYAAFEAFDAAGHNHLVVGPWNHGGWNGDGDRLGAVTFGSATGRHFREAIQAPWFAYWLKDEGARDFAEAVTFEAGTNRWRAWSRWPPEQAQPRTLYMHEGERLAYEPPATASAAFDSYVSDPDHPVPYRHRPIQPTYFPGGSNWSTWLVEDQRFVDDRPDVLSWETPPLEADVTVAGTVTAHLHASTTGTDSDWIVKLIDVYPEAYPDDWTMAGYQLMVSSEVLRGRYREGFEQPLPIPAGEIVAYRIGLHTQNYTFRAGHRIMVQVQSTWFPLIDRNPQTFVPNIFEAAADDYRPATQRVYRSSAHPSHVELQVVSADPDREAAR